MDITADVLFIIISLYLPILSSKHA